MPGASGFVTVRPMTERVTSADGTRIAVHESGSQGGPVVVAVHGYPDDHTVWDDVAAALGTDHRVVAYDVRGAGASDVPATRAGYRMGRLVDDLQAVLERGAPDGPVHLLAHDWGSMQSWPALTDPRLDGRIASFTSISGPSLDHARVWLRGIARDPLPRLRQLAHSYYTVLFQLPVVPEYAIRRGVVDRAVGRRNRADAVNGLNLYRANMRGVLSRTPPGPIRIPVQVIAPRDDPFVTPELATEAPAPFVAELRSHVVDGGHWIVKTHPEVIAGHVRDFIGCTTG
jgi:pimeloyl-ACP methyl ester carboxylesterase